MSSRATIPVKTSLACLTSLFGHHYLKGLLFNTKQTFLLSVYILSAPQNYVLYSHCSIQVGTRTGTPVSSDVCYNTPHFFLQRAQPQPRSLLSPRPNFVTTVAREPPLATTSPRERSSSASLQWPRSHTRTTHQQLHHHHGNFSSSATSFGSRTLSSQRPSCRAGPFMNNTCPHGSVQVFIPARARPTFGHVCYFTLLLAAQPQPQPQSLSSPRYTFVTAMAREPSHAISAYDGFSSATLQWPRSHAHTTHQQLCLQHHDNFSSSANSNGSRTLSAQRPNAARDPSSTALAQPPLVP